ncbi:fimbrial protein [Acinetobacter larvae]|uniref:Fimbrial protein n=1 Tax=Acinetobacter larvae TaxID=1789224 RepID=A0A1B2M3K1_9GAMM|nr:fimbrial protein [Acinetobacter larvae]AOA59721.1 fimbrial protein [Acinetobacter larvae]
MKLINYVLAATASLLTSATLSAAGTAVTFYGEVSDQTCQASIEGNTNGIVLLPTVPANTLATAGQTSGLTPFKISIKGCTAPKADLPIKTKFLGLDVTAGGNLGNAAAGNNAAKNVAIQITADSAGTSAVRLNGPTSVSGLVLKNGATSASYDFGARYIAEGGSVTAGLVTSVVEYTLSYQ